MDMDTYDQPTVPWRGDDDTLQLAEQAPEGYQLQAQNTATSMPAPVAAPGPGKRRGKLSRRNLFGIAALGVGGAVGVTAGAIALEQVLQHNTNGGAATGSADDMQIGHLLRRAGFGASPQDIALYKPLGFNGAVDRLLNYQPVSDAALESQLKALNLDLNLPANQQHWWLLRMAWTQRPLLEKMTLFWSGVLTTSFRKVGGKTGYMRMIVQNNFLRSHAFDTYDNILLGITSDPAMLFYLDLTKSTKNAPNENYAREMMELFTLGLGQYTQQDVYMGAAALTGWHITRGNPLTATYYPGDHSNLTKTYLGHSGNLGYQDVISILANHPATPWFIAHKLFTFFVYENPSSDDLKPLVDAYVNNKHNMGAVMRTLLLSPQFSSDKAYRARLKSPIEFVVGAYRALDIQGQGKGLETITTLTGQPVFDPPNVAGWPGDKVSSLWLNSGTWMARLNYIDTLVTASAKTSTGTYQAVDLQAIINANHIDTPEHFVDYFVSFLLDGNITSDRRALFVNYFSGPTTSSGKQITLTGGKSYDLGRVRGTLYLILSSPEYQLN